MNNRILRGIALILFGVLLCAGSAELNRDVFSAFADVPFSLVGVLAGIIGLVMAFSGREGKGS